MRAILLVAVAACATASTPTNSQAVDAATDTHPHVDASNGIPIDGPASHHDAFVPQDAPVVHNADADTSGALCGANAECTTTGECCLIVGGLGVCTSGTIIGGTCLPI